MDSNSSQTWTSSYLKILDENPPMLPFVSRGNREEIVDIAEPHAHIDREVLRLVAATKFDRQSRLLPIVGEAGMGKTHLFWALKSLGARHPSNPFRCIYVPPPTTESRIGIQVYTPFIEETESSLFAPCARYVFQEAGLSGLDSFHLTFYQRTSRLKRSFPRLSHNLLKVIARYATDSGLRDLALRWLLGHHLHPKDRARLGVDCCLEDDSTVLDTLKLLLEVSSIPTVFYFDEMESPFRTFDEHGQDMFISFIHSLLQKTKNAIIICASLDEIWNTIEESIESSVDSLVMKKQELPPFDVSHLHEYIHNFMAVYWMNQGITNPGDEIYPFSEEDIEAIYQASDGVPREAIRMIQRVLERKLSHI